MTEQQSKDGLDVEALESNPSAHGDMNSTVWANVQQEGYLTAWSSLDTSEEHEEYDEEAVLPKVLSHPSITGHVTSRAPDVTADTHKEEDVRSTLTQQALERRGLELMQSSSSAGARQADSREGVRAVAGRAAMPSVGWQQVQESLWRLQQEVMHGEGSARNVRPIGELMAELVMEAVEQQQAADLARRERRIQQLVIHADGDGVDDDDEMVEDEREVMARPMLRAENPIVRAILQQHQAVSRVQDENVSSEWWLAPTVALVKPRRGRASAVYNGRQSLLLSHPLDELSVLKTDDGIGYGGRGGEQWLVDELDMASFF
jgi:hypothetical protein